MTEKAARGFAQLMVRGLGEIGARGAEDLSSLETLALVSVRMLVGSGAVSLPRLTDFGLDYLAELDQTKPNMLPPIRENIGLAYSNEAELRETGITFHSVQ